MTPSPRQRARRSATREVAQLVRHTPCLSGARWDGSNVLKLDVDLPYPLSSMTSDISVKYSLRNPAT